jgi:hypothetical protein
MPSNRLFFFAAVAVITAGALTFDAPPVEAEEEHHETTIRLDVAAGIAGIDTFDSIRATYSVAMNFGLFPCLREPPQRPNWCYDLNLRIPIWLIPDPRPHPWQEPLVFLGDPHPEPNVRLSDLDVGPSLIVTPEVEVRFNSQSRLVPSLFLGTGFVVEDGHTTRIGQEVFRTTRTTSPAVSWGGALAYGLSDRVAMRFEVRGLTAFLGPVQGFGPRGQQFTAEGGDVTTIFSSAGLTFHF